MKKTILLIFLSLALFGCKNTKKEIPKVDPGFTNYISGFTSGVISVNSNITVRLTADVYFIKL